MPKEFLDRPDIVAVLKQMGGKGMPEGVTTGRLGDPGFPDGLFDSPLQDGFVEMMPPSLSGDPVGGMDGCVIEYGVPRIATANTYLWQG